MIEYMTKQTEALKLLVEALSLYETRTDGLVNKALAAGKEALAQPEQEQGEPVAWLNEEKKIIYWHNTHETDDYHGFKRTTPLYTTPQRKPLTDEQIQECWYRTQGDAELFARAIEAAHGIKE